MVIFDNFIQEHQIGHTDMEDNQTMSRKLITKLVKMKNKFTLNNLNQSITDVVYLVDFELYMLLNESSSLIVWTISHTSPNPIHLEKYNYGGILMGAKIYYNFNLNDKIYCSDKLENIDKHLIVKQRKEKLEKINEL